MHAEAVFTLRTGVAEGRLVFLGAAGSINGQVNPILKVHQGETVQINLVNGEGAQHDIVIDQFGARSDMVVGKGASSSLSFTANKTGEFTYYCSVPGHRAAGMEGRIQVLAGPRAPEVATAPDIVRDPTDLPRPIYTRPAQVVHVDLETVELIGQLDDKTRERLYFDTTTGLLVRRVITRVSPIGRIPEQTDYDDYRGAPTEKWLTRDAT